MEDIFAGIIIVLLGAIFILVRKPFGIWLNIYYKKVGFNYTDKNIVNYITCAGVLAILGGLVILLAYIYP